MQPAVPFRTRIARGRAFEHHSAARHVARLVLVHRVPHGVPRAEIRPARFQRHDDAVHGDDRRTDDAPSPRSRSSRTASCANCSASGRKYAPSARPCSCEADRRPHASRAASVRARRATRSRARRKCRCSTSTCPTRRIARRVRRPAFRRSVRSLRAVAERIAQADIAEAGVGPRAAACQASRSRPAPRSRAAMAMRAGSAATSAIA